MVLEKPQYINLFIMKKIRVRNIKKAKEKGFYIVMNYIGVDNPNIAKERVKIRVLEGGHGIPEDAIERRYYESLENLKELLIVCNEINIYDNTNKFRHIGYICNGKIIWKKDILPEWSSSIL